MVLDAARRSLGWAMLPSIGGLGTVGHILMIRAFELTPSSVLAPFFYLHLDLGADLRLRRLRRRSLIAATIVGAVLSSASGIYVYRAT